MEVELTNVAEIPSVGSKEVEFFGRKVHVVRGVQGVPAAFVDSCQHLGGPLVCQNGEFKCEWHGATFEKNTGRRLSGPARKGTRLMRLPTKIEDGVLKYVYGE